MPITVPTTRRVSFFVNDQFLRTVNMEPEDITGNTNEQVGDIIAHFVYKVFRTKHYKYGSRMLRRRPVNHLQYHCNDDRLAVVDGKIVGV